MDFKDKVFTSFSHGTILRDEMPKPSDDKIARLLEKILARLQAMDDLSPELARELERTRLLVRKIDRMVPDRTVTKKEQ